MMGLAPHIGRQHAHDVVYGACRVVNEKGGTLADVLAADPEISKHLDRAAIERLTDPANYLGMAPQMVDRVLASSVEPFSNHTPGGSAMITRFTRVAPCARRSRSPPTCVRAGLSHQARDARHAVCGRRTRRHARAPRRAEHDDDAQAAGDRRERGRRRRHDRLDQGRDREARRLHAAHDPHQPRDQSRRCIRSCATTRSRTSSRSASWPTCRWCSSRRRTIRRTRSRT